MVGWSALACCLTLVVTGCASRPVRPECKAEYAHTIPECGVKKPKTRAEMQKDHIEVCKIWGGIKECTWVRRDQLYRVLGGYR